MIINYNITATTVFPKFLISFQTLTNKVINKKELSKLRPDTNKIIKTCDFKGGDEDRNGKDLVLFPDCKRENIF